jgi:hypothetical protein
MLFRIALLKPFVGVVPLVGYRVRFMVGNLHELVYDSQSIEGGFEESQSLAYLFPFNRSTIQEFDSRSVVVTFMTTD